MKSRVPELSRGTMLALTIVLTAASVALLAAAAFAPDHNASAPAPAPREPVRQLTPTR